MTESVIRQQIGAAFAGARRAKGMSQLCLASTAGLNSQQTISQLENGRIPPKKHLRKLCEILEIDKKQMVDWLLEIQRIRLASEMGQP